MREVRRGVDKAAAEIFVHVFVNGLVFIPP